MQAWLASNALHYSMYTSENEVTIPEAVCVYCRYMYVHTVNMVTMVLNGE